MSWYRTGTIALTNGSAAVVGTGTAWIQAAASGEGLLAPDGKVYEIASVNSDVGITLGSPYLGASASAQAYSIVPTQSYIRELASQAAALVNAYQAVKDGAGAGKFQDGSAAAPGIAFAGDTNTGLRRTGADSFAMVAGGVDRVTLTTSLLDLAVGFKATGINATPIGGTTPSTGAFTTLSASGNVTVTGGVVQLDNAKYIHAKDASLTPIRMLGINALNVGYVGTIDAGAVTATQLMNNGVAIATLSSTGLAVTGAVSATTGITAGYGYQLGNGYQINWGGAYGAGIPTIEASSAYGFKLYPTGSTSGVSFHLDASGNLGLGVTPSAWIGNRRVMAVGGAVVANINYAAPIGETAYNFYYTSGGTPTYQTNGPAAIVDFNNTTVEGFSWRVAPSGTAGAPVTFTQAMTLDASGNLGLGVTPSAWQSGTKAIESDGVSIWARGTNGGEFLTNAYYNGSAFFYKASAAASRYLQQAGAHRWYTAPSGTAGNAISFTQAMTLDASGVFQVAQTTAGPLDVNGVSVGPSVTGGIDYNHATGTASGILYARFNYAGGNIGSITQSGTTAVAYNTTSDHRLKTNVRNSDAKRFKDIRFVDFEWTDGRHDCGVIAHELQAIYPDLVIGEKDAVEVRTVEIAPAVPAVLDEGGNVVTPEVPAVTEEQTHPVYQQVNYTGLIARMGTVTQQLLAQVEALTARVAALEGNPNA